MNIEHASAADLAQVSTWLTNATDCRTWAGPVVSFPIDSARLASDIMYCWDNSYCLKTAADMAGFGQLIKINDDCYHLARIITNPSCRGQGVARKLCESLLKIAWQHGGSQVSLNVYRTNTRALTLYQHLGFREQADQSDDTIIYMLKVNEEIKMDQTES